MSLLDSENCYIHPDPGLKFNLRELKDGGVEKEYIDIVHHKIIQHARGVLDDFYGDTGIKVHIRYNPKIAKFSKHEIRPDDPMAQTLVKTLIKALNVDADEIINKG